MTKGRKSDTKNYNSNSHDRRGGMGTGKNHDVKNKSGKAVKKITARQAAAIIGIVLLVLLYIAALVTSMVDSSASAVWFRASLVATFALPLLIWIYVWMYGKLTGKHTMADSPARKDDDDVPPSSVQASSPHSGPKDSVS